MRGALSDPKAKASFVEVNPRIQVEHTVTELACGVDLVRAQLKIAKGERLGAITGLGALWPQAAIKADRWALQCRVSALPPAAPEHTGALAAYAEPEGCRVDAAGDPWRPGDRPSALYDPLMAKLCVDVDIEKPFGDVLQKASAAVGAYVIEGVNTNLREHAEILGHAMVADDTVTTKFLEEVLDAVEETGGAAVEVSEKPLVAPATASVVAVFKAAGDAVARGEVVCVVSAMKLEMEVAEAAREGRASR